MKELIEARENLYWLGETDASNCMGKYLDSKTNRFNGEKGDRFDNCVKAFKECRPDVKSPEGMCAKIAKMKGSA